MSQDLDGNLCIYSQFLKTAAIMEITLLNSQKFKLHKNFGYLREDLIFEDLTGSPSKVDKKLYLDELLRELS